MMPLVPGCYWDSASRAQQNSKHTRLWSAKTSRTSSMQPRRVSECWPADACWNRQRDGRDGMSIDKCTPRRQERNGTSAQPELAHLHKRLFASPGRPEAAHGDALGELVSQVKKIGTSNGRHEPAAGNRVYSCISRSRSNNERAAVRPGSVTHSPLFTPLLRRAKSCPCSLPLRPTRHAGHRVWHCCLPRG